MRSSFDPDAAHPWIVSKCYVLASIGQTVGPADYNTLMATDKYSRANPDVIQSWTNAIYRAQKWTEAAQPQEIAKTSEQFFPGISPQALVTGAERYRKLKMWKTTPAIDPKAIDRFQDILVQ